ncbi:hypothetical protein DdX_05905 [Ditylenchus destructor]|uniref:Uncharacterized protein n=1 Tax=Ditylenchus destructor TaxID=166010 RepID=A0AAD4R9G8_9BILA|nr:hypothetical protein DdX_05905 [Ditylenchus destructor]
MGEIYLKRGQDESTGPTTHFPSLPASVIGRVTTAVPAGAGIVFQTTTLLNCLGGSLLFFNVTSRGHLRLADSLEEWTADCFDALLLRWILFSSLKTSSALSGSDHQKRTHDLVTTPKIGVCLSVGGASQGLSQPGGV